MGIIATDPAMARMQALESRAEIESLEELQAERRRLVETGARLKALYGSFGIFDDVRKQRLELAKVAARERLTAENAKVTEGAVDAAAYSDAAYRAFLDNAEREKVRWVLLENDITQIEERIRNRELMLRAYTVEVGLR